MLGVELERDAWNGQWRQREKMDLHADEGGGMSWIRGMCYTLPGKRFPAKAGNICSLARGAFMAARSETHFREGTVLMLDNLCSKPIYLVRAFAETSERN